MGVQRGSTHSSAGVRSASKQLASSAPRLSGSVAYVCLVLGAGATMVHSLSATAAPVHPFRGAPRRAEGPVPPLGPKSTRF